MNSDYLQASGRFSEAPLGGIRMIGHAGLDFVIVTWSLEADRDARVITRSNA